MRNISLVIFTLFCTGCLAGEERVPTREEILDSIVKKEQQKAREQIAANKEARAAAIERAIQCKAWVIVDEKTGGEKNHLEEAKTEVKNLQEMFSLDSADIEKAAILRVSPMLASQLKSLKEMLVFKQGSTRLTPEISKEISALKIRVSATEKALAEFPK